MAALFNGVLTKQDEPMPIANLSGSRSCEVRFSACGGGGGATLAFEEGMRLALGFDFLRAREAFERCELLAPSCAMCHWGVGWSLGPTLNHALKPPLSLAAARAAASRAAELLPPHVPDNSTQLLPPSARDSSLRDAAAGWWLVRALAVRYAANATNAAATVVQRIAYAEAMEAAARAEKSHSLVRYLAADAWMNVAPWDYWASDRRWEGRVSLTCP